MDWERRLRRYLSRSLARPASAGTDIILEEALTKVDLIEKSAVSLTRSELISAIRKLGLSEFGALMCSMPHPRFPNIARTLPYMASAETQISWTGSAGHGLLEQGLSFVRLCAANYADLLGRSLHNAEILDFGCGYGRLARLMYYFTDPENLFAVDPWEQSIALCHQAGLIENFRKSEYLPGSLPVDDKKFDFIYAFSVFTHLSERATRAAFQTLRKYIKVNGLMIITIRPIEYWRRTSRPRIPDETVSALVTQHKSNGFAFAPHPDRDPIDGDVTYGDSSINPTWLAATFHDWRVAGVDRSLNDPMQICVMLRPA